MVPRKESDAKEGNGPSNPLRYEAPEHTTVREVEEGTVRSSTSFVACSGLRDSCPVSTAWYFVGLDRDACFDLLGPFVRSSRSRGFYGIRASSVGGVYGPSFESFVVPFFPGLGYVANRIPRSCSRSFGFSPSFRLEGLSRLFYGLGFVGVLGSDRVFSSIFSFVRVSRVFLGSATVFVLRRSLESFGVFDPSSSPSGLRDLSFVSLERVCYGMLLRRLSVRNPFGTSISLVLSRGCFSLVFLRYRAS